MYEYNAIIDKVVDGDTVEVNIDLGFDIHYRGRVRLYGINTPERINTPESRIRDLEEKERGLAAKARLLELCPLGSSIVLRTQKDAHGKYGRILGMLFKTVNDEESVNQILLHEGHAMVYGEGKT